MTMARPVHCRLTVDILEGGPRFYPLNGNSTNPYPGVGFQPRGVFLYDYNNDGKLGKKRIVDSRHHSAWPMGKLHFHQRWEWHVYNASNAISGRQYRF
jgi:hypothetical protein